MDRFSLAKVFHSLAQKRALVVGDLILDEYLWGETKRISPEAPVPVVSVGRGEFRLGGAGNVANNLLALGCRVEVVSVVGKDADGQQLLSMLDERNVVTDRIVVEKNRVTSRKTRVLASNQQMLRIDHEKNAEIAEQSVTELLSSLGQAIRQADVVLISDYMKGVLTEDVLSFVIGEGRKTATPVIVDPKGSSFLKYRGATLLTPNKKEALRATGLESATEDELRRNMRELAHDLGLDALLLTRSEEGMSLFFGDQKEEHFTADAREVYDVSGAGDTVISTLGACFSSGMSLADSARVANTAAGLVVGKVGTSVVYAEEILEAIGREVHGPAKKIKTAESLAPILDSYRMKGKTVVFTNGCFDLLHAGHVHYLQKARALGDLLVLGLNSDESIRLLKGPLRPLIGEEERAHLLAALGCVDYVVVFNEETPLELLQQLRPQILVKGGDYQPDQVVGKELVESYGGRVELIQFVDGKSTTNIIDKVLSRYRDE